MWQEVINFSVNSFSSAESIVGVSFRWMAMLAPDREFMRR
jgi:hypothetical protein